MSVVNLKDVIGNGVVTVTPGMAKWWLKNNNYENQRPIRTHKVTVFANEMKNGRWYTDPHVMRVVTLSGQVYIVDGQHTLSAIVKSGISRNVLFVTQAAKDKTSLANIYGSIDRGSPRTNFDTLNSIGIPAHFGFSSYMTNKYSSALRSVYSGFSNNIAKEMLTSFVVGDLMLKWEKEILAFCEIAKKTKGVSPRADLLKLIYKAPVLGVVLITMRYEETKASDFWYQVLVDDGLRVGDPRKTFSRWIIQSRINNYTLVSGVKKHSGFDFFKVTARCWQAYLKSEKLSRIYIPKTRDVKIEGTPYDTTTEGYGIDAHLVV